MNAPYHNKALPPGTILREWRLEQVLGVGGFGIVYRARGIYFDELVAIKEYFPSAISDRRDGDTVVPNDSSSEEIHALGLKKFVEEAKLLWNLSKPTRHPNIVSVRSLFEIHGTAYMVMDFESGVSLSQMLRDGRRFDEESLLALMKPIAEGLERAHRVGVLHRDIKPANILVSEEGRPVLIDFGSARFDSGQATNTKVTFHTPPYAALEQYVKTYTQGPWTDIYALGIALAECITGEKPPEVLERLHGGLGQPLSSREWPGFSRPFLRAVDAAMIIKPEERPQSISQWLAMFDAEDVDDPPAPTNDYYDAPTRIAVLQDFVEPSLNKLEQETPSAAIVAMPGEPARPIEPADKVENAKAAPAPARKSRLPLIAGAVVVALCLAVAALFLRGGSQPAPETAPTAAVAPVTAAPVASLPGLPTGIDTLPGEISAMADDARKAGRPRSEVAGLKASSNQASAALAEIKGLMGDPNNAATLQTKTGDLTKSLIGIASSETSALSRDVRNRIRTLRQDVPWADPASRASTSSAEEEAAARAIRNAKNGVDAAIASVNNSAGPVAAIAGARQAIGAYQQFVSATANLDRFALPARRKGFTDAEAMARATYNHIVEAAAGAKPGLFASKARRDAYRQRQDNAAKAKTLITELDQLANNVRASTSPAVIDQAAKRATELNHALISINQVPAPAPATSDD